LGTPWELLSRKGASHFVNFKRGGTTNKRKNDGNWQAKNGKKTRAFCNIEQDASSWGKAKERKQNLYMKATKKQRGRKKGKKKPGPLLADGHQWPETRGGKSIADFTRCQKGNKKKDFELCKWGVTIKWRSTVGHIRNPKC